jgi:Ca2+-binding RTX toxin-like protein
MVLSFDDAIKVVYTPTGDILAIYEFDDGEWELEDFDSEKVPSVEGESILIKEYDDGQLEEVEIYSPTSLSFVDPDPTPAGTILFRSSRLEFEGDGDDDDLEGSDFDDNIFCGDGNDDASGGNGNDNIYGGRGDDDAYGNSGDDDVWGDDGNDRAYGDAGKDDLFGGKGNDQLEGGSEDDKIDGGIGDDTVIGGSGKDSMRGGLGRDKFSFSRTSDSLATDKRDTILDFQSKVDQIVLTAIDANTKTTANDAFTYIGSKAFVGKAGELRYSAGIISADVNGDKKADFQVGLQGAPALLAVDFLL